MFLQLRYASLSYIEGARAMLVNERQPWSFPFCWCRWTGSNVGNCQLQRHIILFMGIFDATWPRCSFENITICVTTCSLSLDILIQVAGSTRPLCVVSTNNNTGIRNFPLLSVNVCSRRAALRARTFRKRKLNASDISRSEQVSSDNANRNWRKCFILFYFTDPTCFYVHLANVARRELLIASSRSLCLALYEL